MDSRIVDFFVKYENTARKIQCINDDVLQYWYMTRRGGEGRGGGGKKERKEKRDSL